MDSPTKGIMDESQQMITHLKSPPQRLPVQQIKQDKYRILTMNCEDCIQRMFENEDVS